LGCQFCSQQLLHILPQAKNACWGRFYKTTFLPKIFHINFQPKIWKNFHPKTFVRTLIWVHFIDFNLEFLGMISRIRGLNYKFKNDQIRFYPYVNFVRKGFIKLGPGAWCYKQWYCCHFNTSSVL
jgi:hypothetical protein